MKLSRWLEHLKEWAEIVFLIATVLGFFLSVWAAIGWELSRLGPWGIAGAVALFVVQVVLFVRSQKWGVGMFACALGGIVISEGWRLGHWLGIVLALLLVMFAVILAARVLRKAGRERHLRKQFLEVEKLESHHYESESLATLDLPLEEELFRRVEREFLTVRRRDYGPMAFPEQSEDLLHKLASDKSPTIEVRRKPKLGVDATEANPVDCTVFAPEQMNRESSGLLQVFLHSPDDRKKAGTAAQKADRTAEERGHRSLVLDAPRGTQFTFEVEIDGFELTRNTETLLWTGNPEAATFPFKVPKRSKWGQHIGTVFVSKDNIPVGSISFQIEVVQRAARDDQRPTGDKARHYHSCFCSYSTLDRVEMLKREQGLRAAGLATFVDAVSLRPGEVWSPKIFKAIDESDLFVLIWSKNACASKWVQKETRYALKRHERFRSPDFRPIPVEGPPIAPVPRSLRAFNFNDDRLLLIRAAELEVAERAKLEAKKKKQKD